MARLTIYELDQKIEDVIKDVEKKVDKETLKLELELIQKDVKIAQKEMERINSYGRWVIIVIAGALITAILNLVIVK